jgi:Tol biopolymer transport system component
VISVSQHGGPVPYRAVSLDDHSERPLPRLSPAWPPPSWSGDGTRVVYSARQQSVFRQQLIVANGDGSSPRLLLEGLITAFAISTDGSTVVTLQIARNDPFGAQHPVVIDLGTGERSTIPCMLGAYRDVAISPDGSRVMLVGGRFACETDPHPGSVDNRAEAWVVDADGSDRAPVLNDISLEQAEALVDMDELTWSPDGQWVAFRAGRLLPGCRPNDAGIWVMRPDGSGLRELTSSWGGPDYGPVWSPDGRWLAFASNRPDGWTEGTACSGASPLRVSVWLMLADGSEPQLVPLESPSSVVGWVPSLR